MKQRIILMVLLLAIICECGWLAWTKHNELQEAQIRYEQGAAEIARQTEALDQLQQELDALSARYEEAKTAELAEIQSQIDEAETQKNEILSQIESMKIAIEEGKQNQKEEVNEYSYYEEVYNALKEGLDKVKGYIAGN